MLVKSLKADKHINNLKESFEVLREYKIKLNPAKCAFGVTSGKFLGFMVNHRGIEANPAKIQALLDMESHDANHSFMPCAKEKIFSGQRSVNNLSKN